MICFGTIVNSACIVLGGVAGLLFGRFLKVRFQESLNMACGVSVLFIGIAGAMEGMLQIQDGSLKSGQALMLVICLALGALIGEAIDQPPHANPLVLKNSLRSFSNHIGDSLGQPRDSRNIHRTGFQAFREFIGHFPIHAV